MLHRLSILAIVLIVATAAASYLVAPAPYKIDLRVGADGAELFASQGGCNWQHTRYRPETVGTFGFYVDQHGVHSVDQLDPSAETGSEFSFVCRVDGDTVALQSLHGSDWQTDERDLDETGSCRVVVRESGISEP